MQIYCYVCCSFFFNTDSRQMAIFVANFVRILDSAVTSKRDNVELQLNDLY